MKALSLSLAVVAAAAGVVAPVALAKKKRCPPGSDDAEYCQHDPGNGDHWRGRGHHHHWRLDHDGSFVRASVVSDRSARP